MKPNLFFAWAGLAAGLLAPGAATAQAVPPPFAQEDITSESKSAAPPVTGVRLGRWTIAFESVPLSQLVAKAGVGGIAHQGDAGASVYWVCYTVPGAAPQRLWFKASPLDGPAHLLSGVEMQALPAGAKPSPGCPALPARLRPVVLLDSGPRLGSPEAGLAATFGPPSETQPDANTYVYLGKTPVRAQGQLILVDRVNALRVQVRGGRVHGIAASQTTTN